MLRRCAEQQLSALGRSESEQAAPEHLPELMAFPALRICLVFFTRSSALTARDPETYLGPPGQRGSGWTTTSAEPTETVPVLPQRPARFSLTDAAPWHDKVNECILQEKEKCAGPVMPGKLMPLGLRVISLHSIYVYI